jgi:hypothetical protein
MKERRSEANDLARTFDPLYPHQTSVKVAERPAMRIVPPLKPLAHLMLQRSV